MTASRALAATTLLLAAGLAHAQTWDFQASLDDKPIGTHRFVVTGEAGARSVDSRADFEVRFLGLQAYAYHHHASERWRGDCLASLSATTDDDGKSTAVHAERAGGATRVTVGGSGRDDPGCVMTFAYWNPAMLRQSQLLNPQTGQLESVRIARVGDGPVEVHGRTVTAARWRIDGAEQPVDVWISPEGEWVGLDAQVRGTHRLSYRLP